MNSVMVKFFDQFLCEAQSKAFSISTDFKEENCLFSKLLLNLALRVRWSVYGEIHIVLGSLYYCFLGKAKVC